MRKIFASILTFGILIFATAASAEIQNFVGVGEHYIESETETLAQAQDKAKLTAELDALEQAQVNIQIYSEMHNFNLTRDEIISITAGILNVTDVKYSLKEDFDGLLIMRAEVTAEIDTDKIAEFVEREIKRRA